MAKNEAMRSIDAGDKTRDVAVETEHPIDVNIQTDPLTDEQEKELNRQDKETQFEKSRLAGDLNKNDPKSKEMRERALRNKQLELDHFFGE